MADAILITEGEYLAMESRYLNTALIHLEVRGRRRDRMKITINLTKEEIGHLRDHTFYDCCSDVEKIMLKVQKEAAKAQPKRASRRR
jgi:hypothetical protein